MTVQSVMIQSGEIIYNKIKQGLINILGDFFLLPQNMEEYNVE